MEEHKMKLIRDMPSKSKWSSVMDHVFRRKRWHVVSDLINHYDYKTYAEIGVEKADTTSYVLKNCKNLKRIYAIDNYPVYEQCTAEMQEERYNQSKHRLDDKKVTFLKVSSVEAARRVPNNLDIVFLDANHRYEFIKQDIAVWYPKLRVGGILIGHDFYLRSFGVVKAVYERFGYFRESDDKTWWVMKSQ